MIFVGPSAAGKDTVADRFKLLTGAQVISTSSQVRKAASEKGLVNPTRGDLQILANQMRTEYGEDIFARLTLKEIEAVSGPLIINGVRNPSEIAVFKGALVVGVDAAQQIRYERTLRRGRPSDPKTWDEFLVCDARENGSLDGTTGQQNLQCLNRADVIIRNEVSSQEGLELAVDRLIDQLIRFKTPASTINVRNAPVEKTKIIVTNGQHGAGKTTIGRFVAGALNSIFASEIGGALRQEVSYNALESATDFDREVMRRELLRDHELRENPIAAPYVVETWHTGNLAYALLRSPELASAYLDELRKQLLRFQVSHLLFTISDNTFFDRMTEKVDPERRNDLLAFYKGIVHQTRKIYADLGLSYEEIDNEQELPEMVSKRSLSLAQKQFSNVDSNLEPDK